MAFGQILKQVIQVQSRRGQNPPHPGLDRVKNVSLRFLLSSLSYVTSPFRCLNRVTLTHGGRNCIVTSKASHPCSPSFANVHIAILSVFELSVISKELAYFRRLNSVERRAQSISVS